MEQGGDVKIGSRRLHQSLVDEEEQASVCLARRLAVVTKRTKYLMALPLINDLRSFQVDNGGSTPFSHSGTLTMGLCHLLHGTSKVVSF